MEFKFLLTKNSPGNELQHEKDKSKEGERGEGDGEGSLEVLVKSHLLLCLEPLV
jgi:hypothetical protein